MCLMGDIKVRVYYSLPVSGNVHLSDCGIGILVYVLYETLDFYYKKSFTFQFLAILFKRDMWMNPSVEMERIELSIQLWGLFVASTRPIRTKEF